MKFLDFFLARGVEEGHARRLSEHLEIACPWLNFEDEVSVPLGVEMLMPDGAAVLDGVANPDDLIDWYNEETASRRFGVSLQDSQSAYLDLCELVTQFGSHDPFGDGDFWVVSDSFSHSNPSIVAFHRIDRGEDFLAALLNWKQRHPLYESVSIINPDGDVLLRA